MVTEESLDPRARGGVRACMRQVRLPLGAAETQRGKEDGLLIEAAIAWSTLG